MWLRITLMLCNKKNSYMQRVRNAKNQKESKHKEKSQFENEAKRLEEECEKTKLKESMERCEGEKKKVEDGAKNMITESKELIVKGLLSCTYHLLITVLRLQKCKRSLQLELERYSLHAREFLGQ
ncbi:hypothetical protein P8452_68752 [Trifolium repens]|nr:hypothetical protein P8452_68752 [Trifolium repens]